MSATLTGIIEWLGAIETSQYGSKQIIIVATDLTERRPNYVQFTLQTDRVIERANALGVGASVIATYDIVGRKYEKKDGSGTGYFTFLECWQIIDDAPQQVVSADQKKVLF